MSERVPLNLRVDERIKTAFDDELHEKFGQIRPYGGTEFEREARAFFDIGDLGALREAVEDVADALKVEGREKEFPERPSADTNDETDIIRYRVHEDVRAQLMKAADEGRNTAGELAGRLMWAYAVTGGVTETLLEKLDDVREEVTARGTSNSTTEEIVAQLELANRGEQFNRDDFLEAAKAAGVGTEKYALSEYLPKVLDEKGFYAHPENPDLFLPTEPDWFPETPDPATLPYQAMDDGDKRLALKVAGLRESGTGYGKFTVTDAVDTLEGRPRHSTVRPLLRAIADDSAENGFVYDDDVPGLRVDGQQAREAEHVNDDALAVVGWLDESEESTDTVETPDDAAMAADDTPETDWVVQAVGELADNPILGIGDINQAVAAATDGDPDDVTGEQRDRVISTAGLVEQPDLEDAYEFSDEGDAADTAPGPDTPPEASPQVATDGGHRQSNPDDAEMEMDRLMSGHPGEKGTPD